VRNNFGRRSALLAVVTVLLTLAACGGHKSAPASVAAPSQELGTVVNFTVPPQILNLPLTEANGTKTTLAAFKGKPLMIADFLSLCTDICPLISANTAAMARTLNADGVGGKVALLEISVDPHRDTAARLAAYQKLYGGPLADWTLLRTSPANTKILWRYFGVEYGRTKEPKPASIDWLTHKPLTYDVYHADDLIFLDGQQHQRFVVQDSANVQGKKTVPAKLVQFLDGAGLKALNKPTPVGNWTVGQGMQVFSWLLDRKLAAPA
jgi:protein SCO1